MSIATSLMAPASDGIERLRGRRGCRIAMRPARYKRMPAATWEPTHRGVGEVMHNEAVLTRATPLVLLSFGIGLVLFFAYVGRGALLIIYVSAVLAVVLTPAVNAVHRFSVMGWRPSRGAAILLILLATAALLVLLFFFAVPPIIADLTDLGAQLPKKVDDLRHRITSVPILRNINLRGIEQYFGTIAGGITSVVTNVTQGIASTVAVATLTAYFILDGDRVFNWAMSLFPCDAAKRLRPTLLRAGAGMRRWLVGQAMLMLILGSASAVVFGLLGIRYFYLLAVFAGIANIIPLLGPILTVIIASLAALMDSPWKVLGVLIFYLVYQQTESAFLTPRIMKSQVKLCSSEVLVALLLGGELAGVVGALVAVPSAVLLSTLIDEYVVKHGVDAKPESAGLDL
jgi:predicted PurR-regulated permease PerM